VKPTRREASIFSVSAIDLFASALGAFIVVALVLLPHFPNTGDAPAAGAEPPVDPPSSPGISLAEVEALRAQAARAEAALAEAERRGRELSEALEAARARAAPPAPTPPNPISPAEVAALQDRIAHSETELQAARARERELALAGARGLQLRFRMRYPVLERRHLGGRDGVRRRRGGRRRPRSGRFECLRQLAPAALRLGQCGLGPRRLGAQRLDFGERDAGRRRRVDRRLGAGRRSVSGVGEVGQQHQCDHDEGPERRREQVDRRHAEDAGLPAGRLHGVPWSIDGLRPIAVLLIAYPRAMVCSSTGGRLSHLEVAAVIRPLDDLA